MPLPGGQSSIAPKQILQTQTVIAYLRNKSRYREELAAQRGHGI